jgi:predicted PurR-regulated permease PerM
MLLWTFMWGTLGAFLDVPIAIATRTMYEQFRSTRWVAEIFSGQSSKESKAVETPT